VRCQPLSILNHLVGLVSSPGWLSGCRSGGSGWFGGTGLHRSPAGLPPSRAPQLWTAVSARGATLWRNTSVPCSVDTGSTGLASMPVSGASMCGAGARWRGLSDAARAVVSSQPSVCRPALSLFVTACRGEVAPAASAIALDLDTARGAVISSRHE